MAKKPFIYTDSVILAPSGSGTWQVLVGAGETARFKRLIYTSSGVFSITAIRDSSNNPFSNATPNKPLTNTLLTEVTDTVPGIQNFDPPIEIVGPRSLNIDIVDTSAGANTVRMAFEAELETGG